MRIVCPYVMVADRINNRLDLQEGTRKFVKAVGGEFFDCTAHEYKYFEHWRGWWRTALETGEPFCIIEQDVVPTLAGIESLRRCNHLWCGCPYYVGGGLTDRSLGCTKFSAALVRRFPSLPEQVSGMDRNCPGGGPHRWVYLDSSIAELLMQRMQPPINHHVHKRHVAQHLKSYG
jgi:hypothetical protein